MIEGRPVIAIGTFVLPSFIIWRIRRYECAEYRDFRNIVQESSTFRFAICGFGDELQRLASNFDCFSGSRRSTPAESRISVSQIALPIRNHNNLCRKAVRRSERNLRPPIRRAGNPVRHSVVRPYPAFGYVKNPEVAEPDIAVPGRMFGNPFRNSSVRYRCAETCVEKCESSCKRVRQGESAHEIRFAICDYPH